MKVLIFSIAYFSVVFLDFFCIFCVDKKYFLP